MHIKIPVISFLKRPLSSVQCLRSDALEECHWVNLLIRKVAEKVLPVEGTAAACLCQLPLIDTKNYSVAQSSALTLCILPEGSFGNKFIIYRIRHHIKFRYFYIFWNFQIKKTTWFTMQEYIWSVAEWSVNSMLLYKVLHSLLLTKHILVG